MAVEVVEARGEDGVARVEVAVDEAHRAELDVVADVGGAVGLADDGFADGKVFQLLFGRDVPAAQVAADFGRHGEVADGRVFPFAAEKRRVVFVVVGDELVGDGFVDVHRARFRLFQQVGEVVSRDEEADVVALAFDVDADDFATFVHRRPAAHAAVDCAGEEDARARAFLQDAVVDAIDDDEAQIAGVAEGVERLALFGNAAQFEGFAEVVVGGDDGEVMHHVHRQQAQFALAVVGADVFDVVLFLVHRVGDDVVIGGNHLAVADNKTGADARFLPGGGVDGAHLVDARFVGGEERIDRERHRCGFAVFILRRQHRLGERAARR